MAKDGNRVSKAAFAKFLETSPGKLQNWEMGSLPQQDDLQLLHHTFGLSYRWLVTGEGEPFDSEKSHLNRVMELEKEIYALKSQLADTRNELQEERALNRRLTNKMLDASDKPMVKESMNNTARVVGEE